MKHYKTADDEHLDIEERPYSIRIGWVMPFDGEFGAFLGDEARPSDPETKIAQEAVKPFAEDDYTFSTLAKAKKALTAANEALFAAKSGKPWPDWALRAKAEGWKPPKGWTP